MQLAHDSCSSLSVKITIILQHIFKSILIDKWVEIRFLIEPLFLLKTTSGLQFVDNECPIVYCRFAKLVSNRNIPT